MQIFFKLDLLKLNKGQMGIKYPHKYVVKHKSAKLFITYAVGKLEAALTISHLI